MVKQHIKGPIRSRPTHRLDRTALDQIGEAAHFTLALARVLAALTRSGAARYGDELVELIEQHVSAAAASAVADPTKPTLDELRAIGKALTPSPPPETYLDCRVRWLSDALGFDDVECTIMGAIARFTIFDRWRQLLRILPPWTGAPTLTKLAVVSGLPVGLVEQRLAPGSRLPRSRLVRGDREGEFAAAHLFSEVMRMPATSQAELVRSLMPSGGPARLEWDDFAHVPLREVAERVISSRQPASILLYGEPGTGKTEFARTLAQRGGCDATFAGLCDDNGNEPERRDRIAHLMILRALCQDRIDRLIVVDEADDILAPHHPKFGSKQWTNLLIEDPKVPTIWIVNDQDKLDPSVLRRMTLAIGFDRPPVAVRRRIVERAARGHRVPLTEAEAYRLAALPASPALIASGLRAACLAGGDADLAHRAVTSVIASLGHAACAEPPRDVAYDPALSSADIDLAHLAARLAAAPTRGWSLLLSGPSGTGKSAYARHLAGRLGLEIEERRGSDLLGPYVGDTESRIAAAFAQTSARGAMLLIDEADSFMRRREMGQARWEYGMVNEMLQQMEHLGVPFVATTNLAGQLDPAVRRRFTLRVAFRAMTSRQVTSLFRARFGLDWPVDEPVPDGQTPGDFAVVGRRAELLGETRARVLLGWLRDEIAARGEIARPIGFLMPAPDTEKSVAAD